MHRGLLRGLLSYVKTQSPPKFPEAAAGGALMLRPETRLSWIAGMLPYIGHADWHVEPSVDWNNPANRPVAAKPLPEVVNPVLGPSKSPSGYPVTHYVGVAGVGEDAAELPADNPRAGMFGYGRQVRQQDLARGGANTIAVLGAVEQCGPWAQGGRATVRPLTREPYVNGPDGFGSGQADGMLAGMADGSARFLSKNIDPGVMRELATIRGGEHVDMAAIEPQPAAAKPPEANGRLPAAPPAANAKPPDGSLPAALREKPQLPPDPKVQARLNDPIAKNFAPQGAAGRRRTVPFSLKYVARQLRP